MGKKQPKITNKKHRKKNKNQNSSKSSRRLNNYSKRSKSRFNFFFSQNGRNSKRGSSKKWQRTINNHDNNFNNYNIKTYNITNNNNISNNNYFIYAPNGNNIQNHNEKPEWMTEETEKIEDSNQRFSKEIMEYVEYISPKNGSLTGRQTTMKRLQQIINKKRPEWKVHLFGSFKQGTSTVFSDLDFEIIIDKNSSRKRDIDELFYLMKILRQFDFCNNIRLIRARVPILKATASTNINVDISVNRHNGYQAADLIKNILSRHKVLRPTIIIIKILLRINGLNEAHTGGMSSFLLFHLVYFYYNIYKKK